MTTGRRILIDGSMAKRGGGFTFLVNIVPLLARLWPQDQFRVVLRDKLIADSIPSAPNLEITYLGELGLKGRLKFTYLQAGKLARDWNADLYFSAGEMAPLNAGCPTISAFRNPNVFNFGEGQGISLKQKLRLYALNALARVSALVSDRVMFVSGDSARWIGESIGLPEERRAVIRHGIDPEPWRQAEPARCAALDRPYVLSVSSVYPYKNYVRLIEAWAQLAERRPETPDLVIVGDCQDPLTSERMEEARLATGALAERIHILGEVPHADIRGYYRNAELFVFPSYLETFGMPVIEAFASESPLVAADIPVFREIAGDAAFFADPFCTKSLAGAIEEALFTAGAAEALRKRGRERLKKFSWERTARTLMATFDEVLAEQGEVRQLPAPVAAQPAHGGANGGLVGPSRIAAHGARAAARALPSL